MKTNLGRRELLLGAAASAAPFLFLGSDGCTNTPSSKGVAAGGGEAVDAGSTAIARIAIDMHNHVYPAGTEPHPHGNGGPGGAGPGGHGPNGAPPNDGGPHDKGPPHEPETMSGPDLALGDELKRSGFTAVCASFVLDFAANVKPGDARTNLLGWFDAVDRELAKGHLRRALSLRDLEAARDQGSPTIIQSVEGAHFIEGDLGRIDEVYARGLRHLQLLHEKDDMVAPLGDTNTGVAHLNGLTAIGVDVVKRCNALGILVDLAHASDATVRAALKVATQPPIVSHTNLDTWTGTNARMAEMMKPRLISKETAKAVADAGGLVGVWTHLTSSLSEFVGSIKAMVDAIGVDHVGLGTDTDLLSRRAGGGTNLAYKDLPRGLFFALADEMQKQGFAAGDIDKVGGGNYCRVFGAVTASAH